MLEEKKNLVKSEKLGKRGKWKGRKWMTNIEKWLNWFLSDLSPSLFSSPKVFGVILIALFWLSSLHYLRPGFIISMILIFLYYLGFTLPLLNFFHYSNYPQLHQKQFSRMNKLICEPLGDFRVGSSKKKSLKYFKQKFKIFMSYRGNG